MKHAHIIPLAGGQAIGATNALKAKPTYLASWEAFAENDKWCKSYFPDIPYHTVDNGIPRLPKVDIITCTPPCSGLSSANTGMSCAAPQNIHMLNVAEFGMQSKTQVILIENAPLLYTEGGIEFSKRFFPLIKKYGYSMQLYKTTSILHGLPQNRKRTFVILWKGKQLPELKWINEPYVPLNKWKVEHGKKQYVFNGKGSDDELVNKLYKHFGSRANLYKEAVTDGPRSAFRLALNLGWGDAKYKTAKYTKLFDRVKYKNVMAISPTFVNDHSNALMWRSIAYMLSPHEDRYLSVRELMSMMGLPKNYEELPLKYVNHIFQNVPVQTTQTLVSEIAQALDGKRKFVNSKFMRVNNIKQQHDSVTAWE
jgi:site-specific DNA-cytosine methylase